MAEMLGYESPDLSSIPTGCYYEDGYQWEVLNRTFFKIMNKVTIFT
jgi:hypothetical protein